MGPVPAGNVWILRDVDVVFPSVVEVQTFALGIQPVTMPDHYITIWNAVALSLLSGTGWQGWRGRQVLLPGDHFVCECSGADGVDLAVSGYVLTLP